MLMYIQGSHGSLGPWEWLFLAIALVIIVIAAVRQKNAAYARTVSLLALSSRLGFDNFEQGPEPDFALGWAFLDPLARGNRRFAFNIFRGTYHGEQMFIFDYHYETGSGKNRKDHYLTMFMLVLKECFPQVTLKPENLLSKIEGAFDSENIKFESAEFSRAFCVHSADKKFAYDVCNAQMMEYLLVNRGLNLQIQGPVISLVFEPQLPVDQFELNLQRLAQIRALLPEYLFTNS